MKIEKIVPIAVLMLVGSGATVFAQSGEMPPQTQAPAPVLTPDQLRNMVAPIALYPDPLLSQVLAATTYPLEVVEAQQWLQQNSGIGGTQLMEAAKQQNWDPSVQALVAFPDVLTLLNRDIRWTTSLGNAFLAQQQDVMNAVQYMRVRAQQNGRLSSTPQQRVSYETQDGQNAVVIEPADPQVIYVPVYNPEYVWGAPAWGYYPPLWYPTVGFGFGFGRGIFLGGFFPSWGYGWGGWGSGWGWGCGWFGGGIYSNAFFFNHYGFHGGYYGGGRFAGGGRGYWQHDPYHRAGVPYANRSVDARFNNSRFSEGRFNGASRFSGSMNGRSQSYSGSRSSSGFAPSNRSMGGAGSYSSPGAGRGYSAPGNSRPSYSGSPASSYRGNPSSGFSGASRGYSAPQMTGRGFSSNSYSAPQTSGRSFSSNSYSAPQMTGRGFSSNSYSAPQTSGRSFSSNSYSAPRSSPAPRSNGGGFNGGGGGGGRSFSGGGHSGGGSAGSGGHSSGGHSHR